MKFKILIALLIVSAIYSIFFFSKFYGFEYEDSFINPSVASSENYFTKIENFRTSEFTKFIGDKEYERKSYTGHYMPYSFYLHIIHLFFNPQVHLIHKIGNFILLLLSTFLIIAPRKDEINFKIIFISSLISSLPFIYIINSALIENMSFFFGILFISWIRYFINKNEDINSKALAIIILSILSIIKRENLIYITLIPLFLGLKDLKELKIILAICLFLNLQLYIDPFFTERLEANSLQKPTFSIDYLIFQLPEYFKALFRFDGFLLIFSTLIFVKLNKKSLYILFVWLLFVVFYSLHYRSKYAINEHKISFLETFRYLVNTLPIFYGVFIFSAKQNFKKYQKLINYSFRVLAIIILFHSMYIFREYISDEYNNYHLINDKLINENKKNKIKVYDNFVLISKLNFNNDNIDLSELNNKSEIEKKPNVFIINRFNDFDMKKFKNLRIIKELSNKNTSVYGVELQ